jgi:serine/threonine protein kinase
LSLPNVGTVLGGKYEIVRLLGEGGMGAVFEAEHKLTQKRVAIKWLRPELAPGSAGAARLIREAQAASRIRHSNVVDVYDVERDGDAIFLVMELLDGETLARVIARRELPLYELLALVLPAMRGVAAAHRQGVIHRDIKPENIFLAREDDHARPIPKVVDFGISKVEERGRAQPSLTRTGSTLGTPLYMSYEQLAGDRTLDGRTDVYAFGVILYEILTGRVPFDAESLPKLVVKVATQIAVSPRELCPDVPPPLSRLVMRALARQRDERTASMEILIRELEPFTTEEGIRAGFSQSELSASQPIGPTPLAPNAGFLAQATQPDTNVAEVTPTAFDAATGATLSETRTPSAALKRPYPFVSPTQHRQRFVPADLSPTEELGADAPVASTPLRSTPPRQLKAHRKHPRAHWLSVAGLGLIALAATAYRALDRPASETVPSQVGAAGGSGAAPTAPALPEKPTPPTSVTRAPDNGADDWTSSRPVEVLDDTHNAALAPDASVRQRPTAVEARGSAREQKEDTARQGGRPAEGAPVLRTQGTSTLLPRPDTRVREQDPKAHGLAREKNSAARETSVPAATPTPSEPAPSPPAAQTATVKAGPEAPPHEEGRDFRVPPPRSQEF